MRKWRNNLRGRCLRGRGGGGGVSDASERGGREQWQKDLRETLPVILKIIGKGKASLVLPSQH